jgi:hypothetical protein
MRTMGRLVRGGDLQQLEDLIRGEACAAAAESDLQQRTGRVRRRLARELGVEAGSVTLERLLDELDDPLRIALSDRRERLVTLVDQLRREAGTVAVLLNQLVELNEHVLSAVTGGERRSRTYSADGALRCGGEASTFRRDV